MNKYILALLLLLIVVIQGSTTCKMKSTYIPASNMGSFVKRYVDSITPDDALVHLFTNPSQDNAIAYSKTLMPFIIPIFAFAVIATIFMIVACIQICCVGCCNSVKCRCTSYPYKSIQIITGLIVVFLLLLIAGGVAGMIFNHDTLAATSNTGCVVESVFNSLISGDNNTNWQGLANLTTLAQNMSVAFQNNIQPINYYFNTTQLAALTSLTSSTGLLYSSVEASSNDCTSISPTFACPNSNDGTDCSAPFMNNFCNSTSGTLGLVNISTEFNTTVSVYASTLQNLTAIISNLQSNRNNVINNLTNLINSTQSLSTDSQNYQSTFQDITSTINYGLYITQISIYVAYSFLILCSLCSLMVLTFILCCKCFKMTCCIQFSWMFYWLMTTVILIISGFQYLASVGIVNTCQTYNYFTTNQSNFAQIGTGDLLNGYSGCLFNNETSLMDGVFVNDQLDQFNALVVDTNVFNNLGNFSTVQTAVNNQVLNFAAYPQTVTLTSTSSTNLTQPLQMLQLLNTYANYSAPNSNQNCSVLKDYFAFNTYNCTPYPVQINTQAIGNNSCILLNTSNTNTFTDRQASLNSPCYNPSFYGDSANSLSNYGNSIQTNVGSLQSFSDYANDYYQYYQGLTGLLTTPIMNNINSFVQPYNDFYNGLSCSFAQTQVRTLYNQVCDQFNPYLYFLSVINISIGAICFAIMILFYFLHPRLAAFSDIEGNIDQMNIAYTIQMNDSNMKQLVETTQRRDY